MTRKDRFRNGDELDDGPGGPEWDGEFTVKELVVECRALDGQRRYTLQFIDPDNGVAEINLGSPGAAQLCIHIAKAAVAACDDDWLTMLMILLTESREESIGRLMDSGHGQQILGED